jgi:hypothetical protein
VSLAYNAKKAPCNWLKNGEVHYSIITSPVRLISVKEESVAHTATNVAGDMSVPMDLNASTIARANAGLKEVGGR